MKARQRFISLLLAFLIIVPYFGNFTYVKAYSEETSATELKGEVKNGIKLFNIDKTIIENIEPDTLVERGATIYENSLDHTPLRADGTENYNTVVNLTTIGINGTDFDWSVFNGDKFTVYFYITKDGQRTEISSATFTKDSNNQLKTNVDWPIDTNGISGFQLGTDFDGNYDVRAELREVNTNTTQGILEFNITIYELPNTNIKIQYNDIYGKPLTENLPSEAEAKNLPSFTLGLLTKEAQEDGEEAPEIKLPRTSTTVNIRNFDQVENIFGEDAKYALSDAGSTDTEYLNTQTHLPITIDNKDKGDFTVGEGDSLKRYSYTIDTGNKANPATITMVYDADVAVPPHKDDGNGPVPVPNGYVRLTFDAEDITDENNIMKGIISSSGEYYGGPKSYIDVKQGVQYDNEKLQAEIKKLEAKYIKEVNGEKTEYAQDKEKPWNPAVPTDTTVETEKTYNAVYSISIAEQIEKAGGLYPRDFGVFKGVDVTQPKFWKDGVVVSKNVTDAEKKKLIEGFLNDDKTKFEDLSERSTENEVKDPTPGEIKVIFSDESSIVVKNQKLYVWNNIIEEKEENKDIPKPKNAVTVEFAPGEHGRLSGTTKYFVNPDADVELTAPTVKADYGYKQKTGKDAWSPEFTSPAKYTTNTKHIAQYEFTKDIVPINPGEDVPEVPANYVTVTFQQGDHGTIDKNQITSYKVNPEKVVDLTGKAPTVVANADYKHVGWDKELKAQFTAKNTDITAKYLKKVETEEPEQDKDAYVKVDFTATGQGNIKQGETSTYWVLKNETVELKGPAVETKANYAFEKWDPAIQTSYAQDATHKAVFKYNGNNVVPQKPGEDKPNVPADFVKVEFNQGSNGSFEQDATTIYWVKPNEQVTVTAPKVTANEDYKHVAWTYGTKEETNLQSVTDTFASETTITAKYLKKVLEEEPTQDKDAYVKVTFNAGTNGTLADDQTEKSYWVLKDTPVTLTAPTVTANQGYKFIQWNPAVQTSYSENTTHEAEYKKIIEYTDPKDKDYVKVTFDPGTQGKIKEGAKAELWVLKDETIDPEIITPALEVNKGYAFKEWNPAVQTKYSVDTKHIAEYTYNGDDVVPQNPGENKPNVPTNFVKVEFKPGVNGTIANTETAIYWVNPEKQVTLTAPKVTANDEYKHVAWTYGEKEVTNIDSVTDTFAEATDITAKYLKKVVTEDPNNTTDYVKVTFKADADEQNPARGTLEGTTTYWVLKNTDVTLTAPKVTPNKGLKFKEWSPAVKNQYDTNTTHTAQYEEKAKVVTENPNDTDYIKVKFDANGGTFGTQTVKEVWVLNGIATFKDASDKVGTPTNETATFKEWQDQATGGTKVEETKVLSTADETFYAAWTGKGKIIDVDDTTTPVPEGYVRLTFDATENGTIGTEQTKAIDVLKGTEYRDEELVAKISAIEKLVTPKDKSKQFDKWQPSVPTTGIVAEQTYTALYKAKDKVVTEDPKDTDYIKVIFNANGGKFGTDDTKEVWVLKDIATFSDAKAKVATPSKDNAIFNEWHDKATDGTKVEDTKVLSTENETFYATWTNKDKVVTVDPKDDSYVKVDFKAEGQGKIKDGETATYWVVKNVEVELTGPQVESNTNYAFDKWDPAIQTTYTEPTTHNAVFKYVGSDVVPQNPGEDKPNVPEKFVKVEFKSGDHGLIPNTETYIYWVNPEKEVTVNAPKVTANTDYKHVAWTYGQKATSGETATTSVTDTFKTATDITAKYLKKVVTEDPNNTTDYVKVNFTASGQGSIKQGEISTYWVLKNETVELKGPAVETKANYAFEKWDPAIQTSYAQDTTHNAVFKYNGNNVVPQKPGEDKPNVPADFVKVKFNQGDNGSFEQDATTIYWVKPNEQVTVTAPKVTANEDYKHVAWTYGDKEAKTLESVTDTFTAETTITAKYLKKVLEEEPTQDQGAYVKVTFNAGTNGTLADDQTEKAYWVLKDTPVTLTAPTVTANQGYKFIQWNPAVQTSYSENTTHEAEYKKIIEYTDPKDKDYVKVTFDPGTQGKIKEGAKAELWVLKDESVDPKAITPELEVNTGYAFKQWNPAVQTKYSVDTKHTAEYTYNGNDVVPQNPGENKPNVPGNFVKVEFKPGVNGTIANTETAIYWVNPEKSVTLTAPKITANDEYKHVAWTYGEKTTTGDNATTSVTDTFAEATDITAKYLKKVVTEDPNNTTDYVKVTFKADAEGQDPARGTLEGITTYWVLKNTDVTLTAPTVTPNKGLKFKEWSPAVKNQYDTNTTHTAQYEEKAKVVTENPNDTDYIKVKFDANGGTFGTQTVKEVWVLNGIATFKDASDKVGTPTNETATFKEWQDQATGGTKLEDTKVLSTADETFYAAWTGKAKIIDVDDTTKPTPEGYVRLTFDATTEGTIGTEQTKSIDVLKGTEYRDTDLVAKISAIEKDVTPKDATKKFNAWDPVVPTTGNVSEQKYEAKYVDKNKIIDVDDTTTPVPTGYVRLTFDAKEGTIDGQKTKTIDVLSSLKYSDKDLQDKIASIKAIPTDNTKKFNAWDPAVPADETPVATSKYEASYVDKDKIIDVVDPKVDPKEGYVRLTFDATTEGAIEGNRNKAIDVLSSVKYNDQDLQNKIESIKAVPHDKTKIFDKWTPEVPTDETQVTTQTYTAQYKAKDKIIDVVDPKVDPVPDGYVRLTFDATTEGTIGTEQTKAIDVLKGTEYRDVDLVAKISAIEKDVTPKDATKKFNAWDPVVPTTGNVSEQTYTAKYVDKNKIIDVDDTTTPVPTGYVRLTFDAKEGTIDGQKTKTIDVLSSLKYSDKDLQDKIASIKAVPHDKTKIFDKWTPEVPTDETQVTTQTYTAQYKAKDKIIDVDDTTTPVPAGYVRLTFDATTEGTIGTEQTKAIDVLKGTEYRDTDLVAKISAIEKDVTPKDATKKFNAWDPVVPTTGNVSEQTYTAKYVDKNKIIDVDDTTTPVPTGYVRLTFDAKEGTIDGQKTKTIDVLSSLKYSDKDLQDKIASIKAIPTDNTKKFNAWNPAVPADETPVATAKYEASYVDKDKIIDVVDPKVDPKEGYVRLTFDATENGAIEGNRNKAIDVLSSVKYNDQDLQNKIESIKAVPHDKTKIFDKWTPEVPTDETQVTTQTYTAQYKAKDKIIDVVDPKVDPVPDGYVRLTFDATTEGTIGTEQTKAIDVLKGTEYRDVDLVAKISAIEKDVTPKDATKKFNAWDPVVPTTGNVSEQKYEAKYVDKNKIIDVDDTTTPVPAGYVRLTFDAKEGTIDGQKTKTIDVLSSLKYSDKDLQDKIASIKAIPTDNTKKFNAWNPAVPADETPVATAKYEASYVDKDKIIDVVDPKVDPKEGYVRLTFDATENGAIEGNRNKAIDVLSSVKYNDTDLQNKIASIKAVPHDKTKIFDKWTPDVPTDETQVTTQTYTAQYKAKDKIIDVVDPKVDPVPDGYVRLTFDATTEGTIGTEQDAPQTKAIDVLKGTEYRDVDLVAKISAIEKDVTPKDATKKFNAWDPVVPTTGNVSEETYTAKYVDNRDIIPETNEDGTKNVKPEGYVTVRFLVNKNGTLAGETVYFVNPTANVTIDRINAPTVTANDGYEIAVPQWKPDLSNDTTTIKENRYYVANFSTKVVNPTEFEINYISGNPDEGSVSPDHEKVAIDVNAANDAGKIKGSEATANTGFKFVKWINEEGKEVSTDAKFTPTVRKSATYIAVFEKETPTPPVTPTDGKLTITKILETAPVRPMMQLFRASGEPIKFKFKITGPNNYNQEFELAAGASNTLENLTHGEYTVKETVTQGYTPFYSLENGQETQAAEFKVTINGDNKDVKVTVTNKNIVNPNDLTIRATKVWVGGPKSDHTAVELKLNRISRKTGSTLENVTSQYKVEVTNDNTSDTITYVWSNLPKHDSEGYEYTYSIEELGVGVDKIYTINGSSYKSEIAPDTVNTANETIAFTITNTYQVQKTDEDIVGTKTWVGVPADVTKPTVKLELWRKTETSAETKAVDATALDQNNQASFGKQDKTDQNGNDYTYFVKEVDEIGQPFNHANYTSEVNGLTVTNTYKSDPIPEPEEYLAIFNGNGGDPVTQRTKVKDGEVINDIKTPTRDGYKFVKWVKAGTSIEFDITKPFSKDYLDADNSVMFTAVWEKEESTPEPKPEAEEYLAVFNGNGGDPVTQRTKIKDGEVITGITQPTRDGYKFVKWVKAGTGIEFDITKPFSKDYLYADNSVMFTAVWEKDDSNTPEPKPEAEEYLAVFNGNGGDPVTQRTKIKDGEVITGISQPTRDGYTFVKWVKAGTGIEFDITKPFSKDYLDSDNSVMFTAVWDKVESTKPVDPRPEPPKPEPPRPEPPKPEPPRPEPPKPVDPPMPSPYYPSYDDSRFIPLGVIPKYITQPESISDSRLDFKSGTHKAYMFGYNDGSIKPDNFITRVEAFALVARIAELPLVDDSRPDFSDVEGGWYNKEVNALVKAGFVHGYTDGTLKLNEPISRAEFIKLVSKIGKDNSVTAPFSDIKGNWAETHINRAYGNRWIDGYVDGTFRPDNSIQRAEVVKILNKAFLRGVTENGLNSLTNRAEIKHFTDLNSSHWAYYELLEATNTHDYRRPSITIDANDELWNRIVK